MSSSILSSQKNIVDETYHDVEMKETVDSNKGNSGIMDSLGVINGKEKSPMCLVNELCRFNLITCRYELIEETGAPHARTFSVLLKLGDKEEYRASASSIRKAQHSVAALALSSTKYPQPLPKSERKVSRCNSQLTPTVELNVLAMKRREQVQYHVYEQPIRPNLLSNMLPFTSSVSNQTSSNPSDLHDYRNIYNQRYHLTRGRLTPWYIATVMVGERQFNGRGKTIQIARHAAAEEALKTLRKLPLPTPTAAAIPVTTNSSTPAMSLIEVDDDDDSKSPVSMIYEAAMKRKYSVHFDVISESGPSHLPCFIVRCTLGQYSAEGRGVRKKTAKRRAAAAVLAELEEKEPIVNSEQTPPSPGINDPTNQIISSPTKEKSPTNRSFKKRLATNKSKKKKKDLPNRLDDKVENLTNQLQKTTISSQIQEQETSKLKLNSLSQCRNGEVVLMKTSFTLNPISRLLQLQMAKKEDEPEFKLISEVDIEHRRKEFTVQCTINIRKNSRSINVPTINNELTTFGYGSNKRIAKRNAAEEMLKVLGYSSSSSTANTTSTNISSSSSTTSSTSLSPILKNPSSNSSLESTHIHFAESDPNQVDSRPSNEKERRVKFMIDNSRDKSLTERLENLSEMTQQLTSQSPNKNGRQIAPGLLYVMSMNQTSGNHHNVSRLIDNNNKDIVD